MPKISVIVPIFGVEKYIERCVRSLFEQTLDNIEFIFVDDCTPDRSVDILKVLIEEYHTRFMEMNHVVRIEKMPTNSGLPAVRRYGVSISTGNYIIHCDSDDWVDETMYKKLYDRAVIDDSDVVVCDYFKSDEITNHVITENVSTLKEGYIIDVLTRKSSSSLWNKLVKRKLYSKDIIFPKNNMGEDGALLVQILWYAKKISYVKDALYYYFFNPSSITNVPTQEKIRQRFNQATANAHIIEKFIKDKSSIYDEALVKYLFDQNYLLVPLIKRSRKDLKIWANSVSGIKSNVYKCHYLSFANKVVFYLFFLKSKFL